MVKIQRALISVFDKTGIVDFAKSLEKHGVEIISTGGTFKLLKEAGVWVKQIDEVTGFPEIMNGRVKTLHPLVHGGILAVRDDENHQRQMKENKIEPIDIVVINLYPFQQVIQKKDVALEVAIENIDIGGPTMLRSAAKNYKFVASVSDVKDYKKLSNEMDKNHGSLSEETRFYLAQKVFALTAQYDTAIQSFLGERLGKAAAPSLESENLSYETLESLRYGENPHQKAALLVQSKEKGKKPYQQLNGKEMSFNNLLDFFACLGILQEFSEPTACVIKHTNPCGICENQNLTKAVSGAIDSDPISAFGGIVGLNRNCTLKEVKEIFKKLNFFEIIIAPSYEKDALELLKTKKNLRVLKIKATQLKVKKGAADYRFFGDYLLKQDADQPIPNFEKDLRKNLKTATKKTPTAKDIEELLFAWKCVKVVKSNAIVITKDKRTVGIGAGQMSRVGSMEIACRQAGKKAIGAYVGSDAFFPMPDNIDVAAKAGIKAIIQPGGSIKDKDVIAACDKKKVCMVFTGQRHFKH